MNKIGIHPSIMCAKPWDVKEYVEKFEQVGIDSMHFDVMDGHFVSNVMLGTHFFDDVHEISSIPFDVHLTCIKPEDYFDIFKWRKGDMCAFHPETIDDPKTGLLALKQRGVKAGLALAPNVSLDYLIDCLDEIDYVLYLCVYPGFPSQTMRPDAIDRLKKVREICDKANHEIRIFADGNTSKENVAKLIDAGASDLITGTSSMFKEGPDKFLDIYDDYMKEVNKC